MGAGSLHGRARPGILGTRHPCQTHGRGLSIVHDATGRRTPYAFFYVSRVYEAAILAWQAVRFIQCDAIVCRIQAGSYFGGSTYPVSHADTNCSSSVAQEAAHRSVAVGDTGDAAVSHQLGNR